MCTSRILFNHMPSTGLNSGKDGGCQRAANHERISMECCCNLLIFLSKLSETHKKGNSVIFGEVGLIRQHAWKINWIEFTKKALSMMELHLHCPLEREARRRTMKLLNIHQRPPLVLGTAPAFHVILLLVLLAPLLLVLLLLLLLVGHSSASTFAAVDCTSCPRFHQEILSAFCKSSNDRSVLRGRVLKSSLL